MINCTYQRHGMHSTPSQTANPVRSVPRRALRLCLATILGVVALTPVVAPSAWAGDTSGVVGNGTQTIGELGAWRDASWGNSLADWHYTVGGGSDSNWSNNQYFNTTTTPNDKTSSVHNGSTRAVRMWRDAGYSNTNMCLNDPGTGVSYQDADLSNNPGMQDAISSHAFLALPSC